MNPSYDCHAGTKPRKKKILNDSKQITLIWKGRGKASSRKALFSENFSRSNSSNSQSTESISDIDT